jgi:hypothetical protein
VYDVAAVPNFQLPATPETNWRAAKTPAGYGDSDLVSQTAKRTTAYFRYKLTLNTAYLAVNMSVVCDDGAVVYVNGVEMNRLNMPAGVVTDATSAVAAKNSPEESQATLFAVAPSRLIVGPNIIAVEVHNFVPGGNTDMRFDAAMTAQLLPSPSPSPAPNTELALVAKRSVWRFFDSGEDLLLTPASAWASNSFDDGYWRSGPAPLGFGDPVPATPVASLGITTYYRTTFLVPFVARLTSLVANVARDDGVMCYLNGVEALRSNLPKVCAVCVCVRVRVCVRVCLRACACVYLVHR